MNPLDQLADISVPESVSIWPLAWGYWIAIAGFIIVITWILYGIIRARKYSQIKRQAKHAIDNIDLHDAYFCHRIQKKKKKTFIHYFPDAPISAIHGKAWQAKLLDSYQGQRGHDLEVACAHIFSSLYERPASSIEQNTLIENNQIAKLSIIDWVNTSIPKRNKMQKESYRSSAGEAMLTQARPHNQSLKVTQKDQTYV